MLSYPLNPDNPGTYDRFAGSFEESTKLFAPMYYSDSPEDFILIEKIIKKGLNGDFDSKRDWIIELGCGTGRLTIPMLKKGWNIIGIDNSRNMIKRLKAKLKSHDKLIGAIDKRLQIVNAEIKDIEKNHFDNRRIKLIISPWSFLHSFSLVEQEFILRKLFGFLEAGGSIIDFDAYQVFWNDHQIANVSLSKKNDNKVHRNHLLKKTAKLGREHEFEYFLVDDYYLQNTLLPAIIQERKIIQNSKLVFLEQYLVQPPYDFVSRLQKAGFESYYVLNQKLAPFVYHKGMTENAAGLIYISRKLGSTN